MEKFGKHWGKTGHVLVMEMDHRDIRHRHPWFVLAHEWPCDGWDECEDPNEYAGEIVWRGGPMNGGVFPEHVNRTPICSIKPMGNSDPNVPILKQFGEDFNFEPGIVGGWIFTLPEEIGPVLAHVMDWYWDSGLGKKSATPMKAWNA